jgi:Zn-dependent protease with chaperone function
VTEPWNGRHVHNDVKEQFAPWSGTRASAADVYDEGRTWLRRGLRRQRAAVVTALVFSWTGLWTAPWGVAFGGLLGMLAAGGFVTGWSVEHHLFAVGIGQPVSMIGLASGLLLGALAGILFTAALLVSNPLAAVISVACGALMSLLMVTLVAVLERPLLRIRGYRRLSRDEARRVAPLVHHVAAAMELDGLPRFAMTDMVIPNAWTHMRTIVLTAGLLQMLDDEELTAVLAHELHHWRQGDAVGLRLLWAAALPTALLLDLGTWIGGGSRGPQGSSAAGAVDSPRIGARGFLAFVSWAIAWSSWFITKMVLAPMAAATQRRYEFEADAAAASVGFAAALTRALWKIGAFESGRTGWERAIVATHPPVALRLEALAPRQDDDIDFQEADFGRPSLSDLVRIVRSAF